MKIAKIYISFFENKKTIEELMEILKIKKKLIRHQVGCDWGLKYIPEFRFYNDNTIEQAEKIDRLITKIHNND